MTLEQIADDPKSEAIVQSAVEVAIRAVYTTGEFSYTDAAEWVGVRADSIGQAILHRESYIPDTPESDKNLDFPVRGAGWECDCKHCGAYRARASTKVETPECNPDAHRPMPEVMADFYTAQAVTEVCDTHISDQIADELDAEAERLVHIGSEEWGATAKMLRTRAKAVREHLRE